MTTKSLVGVRNVHARALIDTAAHVRVMEADPGPHVPSVFVTPMRDNVTPTRDGRSTLHVPTRQARKPRSGSASGAPLALLVSPSGLGLSPILRAQKIFLDAIGSTESMTGTEWWAEFGDHMQGPLLVSVSDLSGPQDAIQIVRAHCAVALVVVVQGNRHQHRHVHAVVVGEQAALKNDLGALHLPVGAVDVSPRGKVSPYSAKSMAANVLDSIRYALALGSNSKRETAIAVVGWGSGLDLIAEELQRDYCSGAPDGRQCSECSKPLTGRSDELTCGPTCRQRLCRRKKREKAVTARSMSVGVTVPKGYVPTPASVGGVLKAFRSSKGLSGDEPAEAIVLQVRAALARRGQTLRARELFGALDWVGAVAAA